jgi:carboxypeptidase Q
MKKTTTTVLLLLFCLLLQSVSPGRAQSVPNQADVFAQIRKEGMDNSQIMRTLHYFTDVYGPRLTGSPNLLAAGNWAVKQMTDWGLENAHLEPWDFGHPGWVNVRAAGFITAPVQDSLVFEVLAWTPGTKKAVRGQAFQLIIPTVPAPRDPNLPPLPPNTPAPQLPPTQAELTAYFDSIKSQVEGKMVLIGKPGVVPVNINPQPKRLNDEDLKKRFDPSATPQPFPTPGPTPVPREGQLTFQQVAEQLDKFLIDNKAAVRINDAGREHGQIRAFNNRSFDVTKTVPTVVMRNEDFGRIARLMADGSAVSLEFDIQNQNFPEKPKKDNKNGAKEEYLSYNTIGEITGTDKKDEVIMLGGHLDSWHAATGATDNAIGCAIMMEAARILKAVGVKPRRTVRVALWSGEEQGLLGSQAYVKQHFGSFETPVPGFEKFGGYFNIDSGTGRARGMSIFGPPEAASVLREALAPYSEFGFMGVISTRSRGLGGSDNTSFNQAGLPGIGVQQDPIEYGSATWHTNLDTYERIIEDDVKKSAIVIASAVYVLAMRDEMLPRYSREQMPALPTPAPTPSPTPAPTPRR